MPPNSPISIPAERARSILGLIPVEIIAVSHLIFRFSVSMPSTCLPPRIRTTLSSVSTSIPCSLRIVLMISLGFLSNALGNIRSSTSIRITSQPPFFSAMPTSTPMKPDPIIATVLLSYARILSTSARLLKVKTPALSTPAIPGIIASAPVAIISLS